MSAVLKECFKRPGHRQSPAKSAALKAREYFSDRIMGPSKRKNNWELSSTGYGFDVIFNDSFIGVFEM